MPGENRLLAKPGPQMCTLPGALHDPGRSRTIDRQQAARDRHPRRIGPFFCVCAADIHHHFVAETLVHEPEERGTRWWGGPDTRPIDLAAGPMDGVRDHSGKPTPTECLIPGYSIPE